MDPAPITASSGVTDVSAFRGESPWQALVGFGKEIFIAELGRCDTSRLWDTGSSSWRAYLEPRRRVHSGSSGKDQAAALVFRHLISLIGLIRLRILASSTAYTIHLEDQVVALALPMAPGFLPLPEFDVELAFSLRTLSGQRASQLEMVNGHSRCDPGRGTSIDLFCGVKLQFTARACRARRA
jgi:hypothetical protein